MHKGSGKLKRKLKSLFKFLGYLLSFFIILCAVLVIAGNYFSPELTKHKAEIEKWVGNVFSTPVQFNNIEFGWYRYEPEITFNKVTALSSETNQPLMQVRRVSIYLSLFKSLWQRKIIPSAIVLSGSSLKISQHEDKTFFVKGFPELGQKNDKPFATESRLIEFMGALSRQPNLMMNNINIQYQPLSGDERNITLHHLGFENVGDRHIVSGKGVLKQSQPVDVALMFSWAGEPVKLSSLDGQGYLAVSDLSLPQWLKSKYQNQWGIQEGRIKAKVWVDFHKGVIESIQTNLIINDLSISADRINVTHKIKQLSGDFGWRNEKDRWVFAGDNILLDMPSHMWPMSNFYLSIKHDGNMQAISPDILNIGFINIEDVMPYIDSFAPFPAKVRKAISDLNLRGNLQNTVIQFSSGWNDWQGIAITSEFQHLRILPTDRFPGIVNLTGKFEWDQHAGLLELAGENTVFTMPRLFDKPISLRNVKGHISISLDSDSSWLLKSTDLFLENSDVKANVNALFRLPEKGYPYADLDGKFTLYRAKHISTYLPMHIFSDNLQAWLRDAFRNGRVEDGYAKLKGDLGKFPFKNKEGEFQIGGNVKNVDLSFASDWPEVKKINGNLIFERDGMQVNADSGETLGIPFGHVYASIPGFSDNVSLLTVNVDPINTDFKMGLQYVNASPLDHILGSTFQNMRLDGPMRLSLALAVPLHHPDKTNVSGQIDIQDDVMELSAWGLTVDRLNGIVHFTETSINSNNITGSLFDKPLSLKLKTVEIKNDKIIKALFNTRLDIDDVKRWLKLDSLSIARGQAVIAGELGLAFNKPINLILMSDLKGISLDLPDPYAKKSDDIVNAKADLVIASNEPLKAKVTYGKMLSAALIASQNEFGRVSLDALNLSFGADLASWPPGDGLYLSGTFDYLDLPTIQKYASQDNQGQFSKDFLKRINITVKKFDLFGQTIHDLKLNIRPDHADWDVSLKSSKMVGQLHVPAVITRHKKITASFSKLNLSKFDNNSDQPAIDPENFPTISASINNFTYNKIRLGSILFRLTPISKGVQINALEVSSPYAKLTANGKWVKSGNQQITTLEGGVKASNVHDMINSFGLDAHNLIAQNGRLQFSLYWPGSPYSPDFTRIDGSASMKIGKGRIVDIGAENSAKMSLGQMLSVFSLQTIPRRLSLDFSDIFQKGYSFDSVNADFKIEDGDIFTTNFTFEGPVAKIKIDGRIGLTQEDYDFVLSVTPYVTSSLPVAATLLTGNPLIGLGAFAVNAVVGSQVSKVTTHYYLVTGPWKNPSWRTIKN